MSWEESGQVVIGEHEYVLCFNRIKCTRAVWVGQRRDKPTGSSSTMKSEPHRRLKADIQTMGRAHISERMNISKVTCDGGRILISPGRLALLTRFDLVFICR